jgi:DNA-binding MarR family transcriptional regulator
MTERGAATYDSIDAKQAAWINELARGLTPRDLETARRVLDKLCGGLEADGEAAAGAKREEDSDG